MICEKVIFINLYRLIFDYKEFLDLVCVYKRFCFLVCCVRDEKVRVNGFLWVFLIDLM